jgi:hypothetical protein
VAKSSNANEQTWEKRVWIYAKVSSLLSWGCDVFKINILPFFLRTFIIPQDLKLLRQVWQRYYQRNVKWIIKPPASARGTGIKVVNRWSQIPKRKPLIVQR